MIKGKLANIVAGLIGLAFAGFVYFYSNTFPVVDAASLGPDFFPKLLAIGMAIFTVAHLVITITSDIPHDFGTLSLKDPGVRRIVWCLLATIAFAYIMKPVGFIIGGIIFMFVVCYILGMRKYPLMITVSIIIPIAVYSLFRYALKIFLPAGILKNILG